MDLDPSPALVDPGFFEAVQTQFQENRERARQSQRGARYLLQGLLVCAQCGYAYYGKSVSRKSAKGKQHEYAYYRCIGSDAYRFGGGQICDDLQVRTDLLEQTVWREVCDLLQDRQRLQQEYERRLDHPKPEDQNLALVQAQRGKIRQGVVRLIDSYADGFVRKEEFEPRITRFRQRLAIIEKQAQQIQVKNCPVGISNGYSSPGGIWRQSERSPGGGVWQMRRELIRMLVNEWNRKREIDVIFEYFQISAN